MSWIRHRAAGFYRRLRRGLFRRLRPRPCHLHDSPGESAREPDALFVVLSLSGLVLYRVGLRELPAQLLFALEPESGVSLWRLQPALHAVLRLPQHAPEHSLLGLPAGPRQSSSWSLLFLCPCRVVNKRPRLPFFRPAHV